MIKLIKRISDKKYLKSLDNDEWTDIVGEALQMTYRECETAKTELLETYAQNEIIDVVDFTRNKPITSEEIRELKQLLKKS